MELSVVKSTNSCDIIENDDDTRSQFWKNIDIEKDLEIFLYEYENIRLKKKKQNPLLWTNEIIIN